MLKRLEELRRRAVEAAAAVEHPSFVLTLVHGSDDDAYPAAVLRVCGDIL